MRGEAFVTHYDNLKVALNAPPEVIRAAYKVLAQQFHPDKFSDRIEAERRMKIINVAYEVLSDPDQRREHDLWIEQQMSSAPRPKQASESAQFGGENRARSHQEPDAEEIARFERAAAERRALNANQAGNWGSLKRALIGFFKTLNHWIGRLVTYVFGIGLAVLLLYGFISYDFDANKTSSSQRLLSVSKKLDNEFDPRQLVISYPQYDMKSGIFSGRVANQSQHALQNFSVSITLLDCAQQCVTVGDRALLINAYVPSGQSRDFSSSPIASLPIPGSEPVFRGTSRYQWSVLSATPSR